MKEFNSSNYIICEHSCNFVANFDMILKKNKTNRKNIKGIENFCTQLQENERLCTLSNSQKSTKSQLLISKRGFYDFYFFPLNQSKTCGEPAGSIVNRKWKIELPRIKRFSQEIKKSPL